MKLMNSYIVLAILAITILVFVSMGASTNENINVGGLTNENINVGGLTNENMNMEASVLVTTDKIAYNKSENVRFTVFNIGITPINFDSFTHIIIKDSQGDKIYSYELFCRGVCGAIFVSTSDINWGGTFKWSWDQKIYEGIQVSSGWYQAAIDGYTSNWFYVR